MSNVKNHLNTDLMRFQVSADRLISPFDTNMTDETSVQTKCFSSCTVLVIVLLLRDLMYSPKTRLLSNVYFKYNYCMHLNITHFSELKTLEWWIYRD